MQSSTLDKTPLHKLHVEAGARMAPFAGYEMPIQYPMGVLKEHLHTRNKAGLFDVSHMGQIKLHGPGAAAALERLVPIDVLDLPRGQQRYALLTNEDGGIVDDLMVANGGGYLMLIVNAACKHSDLAYLERHLDGACEVEPLFDRALLAIQGPGAVRALACLAQGVESMTFMQFASVKILGEECYVSRSGYTGEDGFEISVSANRAMNVANALLAWPDVELIGLGARDSLRLEAGLCLYGHDMTASTTPIEASLLWSISKVRRADGSRAGGFPGAERIFAQQHDGVARKRVGLLGVDRTPVREGSDLVDGQGRQIGTVTSGGFGPTVNGPVAMGFLDSDSCAIGTDVWAVVRGRPVPMRVAKMPFVDPRYYRG